MIRCLLLLFLLAHPVVAQDIPILNSEKPEVANASAGILRALDKLTGQVTDLTLGVNEKVTFGRIGITLLECRYPTANPSGDAFVHIMVDEIGKDQPVFGGWVIASSPALYAMDHARYDVWALRCITS